MRDLEKDLSNFNYNSKTLLAHYNIVGPRKKKFRAKVGGGKAREASNDISQCMKWLQFV